MPHDKAKLNKTIKKLKELIKDEQNKIGEFLEKLSYKSHRLLAPDLQRKSKRARNILFHLYDSKMANQQELIKKKLG